MFAADLQHPEDIFHSHCDRDPKPVFRAARMSSPIIPTINLSRDTHQEQAAAIRHALSTVGFFVVEGSGIDTSMIRNVFYHVSAPDMYIIGSGSHSDV